MGFNSGFKGLNAMDAKIDAEIKSMRFDTMRTGVISCCLMFFRD